MKNVLPIVYTDVGCTRRRTVPNAIPTSSVTYVVHNTPPKNASGALIVEGITRSSLALYCDQTSVIVRGGARSGGLRSGIKDGAKEGGNATLIANGNLKKERECVKLKR